MFVKFVILPIILPLVYGDDLKLLILHNNDMHARFEETSRNSGTCKVTDRNSNCFGGFARIAHEVRKYRRMQDTSDTKVIFLNAGDTYTGTVWFNVHQWRICADFLNLLQPEAISLGNHEFDLGVAGLVPFIKVLKMPVLASNLDFTQTPELNLIKRSTIIEVSGRKIGIIGYLTQETKQISSPGPVIFTDEVQAVRAESEILDKQGVKIIIALGHSGYLIDQKIAKDVPLVDLVIGGHTNTFLWNGKKPDLETPEDSYPKVVVQKSGKKVPVVQAYAYTKYLGRLNTTFDGNGDLREFAGQPILLDASVPQDGDVLKLVEQYRPEVEALNRKVVGQSRVVLDGTCRQAECNFGNLISDSFVYYVASLNVGQYWTNYPICLINGGTVRNTINPSMDGNITRGELLGAQPFGNQVILLSLKGSDLLETLELGVRSNGETSYGEFLQFSGLHVVYNRTRPSGSRVVSVQVRCGQCDIPVYNQLNLTETYNVITNSFLVNGGDGHYVLEKKSFNKTIQDLSDVDTIQWYISRYSPIYPEVQGRIQFISEGNVQKTQTIQCNYAQRNCFNVIVFALISFTKFIL